MGRRKRRRRGRGSGDHGDINPDVLRARKAAAAKAIHELFICDTHDVMELIDALEETADLLDVKLEILYDELDEEGG